MGVRFTSSILVGLDEGAVDASGPPSKSIAVSTGPDGVGEEVNASDPSAEGLEVGNISPLPNINQSRFRVGNFFLMASMVFRVGFCFPAMTLLKVAGEIPVYCEKVCWFICWLSMSCLILSFISLEFCPKGL